MCGPRAETRQLLAIITLVRRILRIVNVLIAIVCIIAAIAFYWVFYRALPKTSGSLTTLVTQPVEVSRDDLGIPHIKAKTLDDALFVQGYVTAEDRMFQMDAMRRQAAGELSEVFGAATLEADIEARRLRLRRVAEQMYTSLPEADKAELAAYARGVNAYIESHHGRYGFEFTVIRYDPRPWSVVDSLLTGLNMYRALTHTWKMKIEKQQMLSTGEPDKVKFLFAGPSPAPMPGSNAWAVSGAHSADGKPLLSNDMHLEFSIPGIWHAVQIQAPGVDVAGVALPGLPGVIAGHNDRIAWGITNLGFDVEDIYSEKMDLRTGRYVFKGSLEQAHAEREIVLVKNRAAEEINLWVTRHGPVFEQTNALAYALRWTAFEPEGFPFVFIDVDRAQNWDEFKHAISRLGGPSLNFVYADVDGNIGYHAAGRLPVRHFGGGVPVDGSTGENEWDGFIPFDELPQQFNPAEGIIASANNNPFPANYPYAVSGNFAAPDRVEQIRNLLRSGGSKLKPQDTLRIQKDVYSALHANIARLVVAAYDKRGAVSGPLNDAIALLRSWDGQMDKDRAAPLIASLVYDHLRKSVAERASAGSNVAYTADISAAVVTQLLRDQPKDWFTDYNALLLQSFADGMDEGQRLQGTNPNGWKWGKALYLEIKNPVGGSLPVIGPWFNVGPYPMSGGPTTVKQITPRLGPSERMNFSLGNWDHSLWNLLTGESGHRASWHYKDEFDAWYYGESFPMPFRNMEAGSGVQFIPESR
jgi:penicillin amidase